MSWLMNSLPLSLSNERIRNGMRASIASSAPESIVNELLRALAFSVQPVAKSTMVRVRQNSPMRVGPQWATVSASTAPGRPSSSSPAFLIVMLLRSGSDAALVELIPLSLAASRVALRWRSMVAAPIAMSSSASPSVNPSSSPAASSAGSHWGSMAFRYLLQGMSASSHTCSSNLNEPGE